MYVDSQLELSDSQQVLATAVSENTIDLGLADLDIGAGQPLYVVISVAVAYDAGATVQVDVVDDDNAALSSPATLQTIGTTGASPAAGTQLVGVIYPDVVTQRYMGLNYTITGSPTTGSLDAFVTTDVDQFKAYASGYSIS